MNVKSSMAGALIAALGLMFYVYCNPSVARVQSYVNNPLQQVSQSVSTSGSASGFAYAQLTVDGDQFTFDQGGLETPRARSLTALMRVFGSSEKATYVNLLNAVGSQGWEIVAIDTAESIVTFKRRL